MTYNEKIYSEIYEVLKIIDIMMKANFKARREIFLALGNKHKEKIFSKLFPNDTNIKEKIEYLRKLEEFNKTAKEKVDLKILSENSIIALNLLLSNLKKNSDLIEKISEKDLKNKESVKSIVSFLMNTDTERTKEIFEIKTEDDIKNFNELKIRKCIECIENSDDSNEEQKISEMLNEFLNPKEDGEKGIAIEKNLSKIITKFENNYTGNLFAKTELKEKYFTPEQREILLNEIETKIEDLKK